MLLKEVYNDFFVQIRTIYDAGEAGAITDIIFRWAAGATRQEVISNPDKTISSETSGVLKAALDKLLQYEPVQYITGEAWFYKMRFTVKNAVLIPRPETEELVLEALGFIKHKASIEVIDVGTGSGCIAVAMKKNKPDAHITAIDISEAALEVAQKNAQANDCTILFKQLDFLNAGEWPGLGKYDVIISNPPYIPARENTSMDQHVTRYEPHQALFVADDNALIFYKSILAFATTHLAPDGKIFMEIHEDAGQATAALFDAGNYETSILKDMSGKDRMITAIRRR